jgi:hypothetical protein
MGQAQPRSRSWLRTAITARPSTTLAVVGLAWILAHVVGLLGPLSEATFILLGLTTLSSSIVGVRRHRPSVRWPWRLVSVALLLFLVGGALRQALGTFGNLSADRSLWPDYVALLGYCLSAAAVLGFVRARWRGRGHDVDAVLDSAVAALGALAMAWVYLITPALFRADIPVHVRLSLAVFPPFSVFLVAVAARVAFAAGMRPSVAQRLFLGAMVLTLTGDVVHTLADAHLVAIPPRLIEVPYALAFLTIAVTFLHPTMRELTEPVPSDQVAPTRGRLAVVAASLGIPALVSLTKSQADGAESAVLVVIVLLLTVAAVARVTRALREHARSEARLAHEASHDQLTGLANRSFVLEHLGRVLRQAQADRSAGVVVLFLDIDRFKLVNDTGGTASATSCWWRWPTASTSKSAPRTWWPASGATSSSSFSAASPIGPPACARPSGCGCASRSPINCGERTSSRQLAWAWCSPTRTTGTRTQRRSSATPTRRCIRPRRPVGTGWPPSMRPCATGWPNGSCSNRTCAGRSSTASCRFTSSPSSASPANGSTASRPWCDGPTPPGGWCRRPPSSPSPRRPV